MNNSKVIWITGASSGIGEAVAYAFSAQGNKLILSARREDELMRVKTRCIENGAPESAIQVMPLDVTDSDSLPEAAEQAFSIFGDIDLLINNAGISQRSECIDTDMATYRRLFEVDVFGQIALTKAVLPTMLKRGRGHIAVTASVAGKLGVSQRTGYCAAKHAMMGFFDALRAEVTHKGLFVSTIVPGFIRTPITYHALNGGGSAYGKMDDDIASGMDVNKAAQVIVKGLNKKKKEISVGEGIEMFGLWVKRFVPSLLFKIMAKRAEKEAKH